FQSLTTEEEEWLDGQGNFIEKFLLLEIIKSLKKMNLGSDDVRLEEYLHGYKWNNKNKKSCNSKSQKLSCT
ncbi:hypothetical protein VP01_13201g1, partial [Puccinia sorghi]